MLLRCQMTKLCRIPAQILGSRLPGAGSDFGRVYLLWFRYGATVEDLLPGRHRWYGPAWPGWNGPAISSVRLWVRESRIGKPVLRAEANPSSGQFFRLEKCIFTAFTRKADVLQSVLNHPAGGVTAVSHQLIGSVVREPSPSVRQNQRHVLIPWVDFERMTFKLQAVSTEYLQNRWDRHFIPNFDAQPDHFESRAGFLQNPNTSQMWRTNLLPPVYRFHAEAEFDTYMKHKTRENSA